MTISEIQAEGTRLLKIIDKMCQAHGLRYFVVYGTLLGAVRHQGPIPWDDDVDIALPRPDYDKLVALLRSENTSVDTHFFSEGDEGYPVFWSKLTSAKTQMVEAEADFPDEYGVFVDIFPIDGLPNRLAFLHKNYVYQLHRLFQYSYGIRHSPTGSPGRDAVKRMIGVTRIVVPRNLYVRLLDRATRRFAFEPDEASAILVSNWPLSKEIIEPDQLSASTKLPYAHLTVSAFSAPTAMLARQYGPGWRVPIKRARSAHGVARWRDQTVSNPDGHTTSATNGE